jgi:hypothetical protein
MPPKHPTMPATTPTTGTWERNATIAACISATESSPRLASCSRIPPVSRSSTGRTMRPRSASRKVSSSAPAILAPETSPMPPPWKSPSTASTTASWPSRSPRATTTPSSHAGTTPCGCRCGDSSRSNGPISSRKVPRSSSADALSRAESSVNLVPVRASAVTTGSLPRLGRAGGRRCRGSRRSR